MIWEGNPEYSAAPFLDARKNRASKKLMNRHESIEKTTQVQKKRANGARSVSFLCFFFLNWILDTFWFPDVTVSSIHILMYSPSCKNNMVLANSCYRAWSTCNLLGGYWFTGRRSHCSVRAVSKYFMPFILFIKFFTYLIFPFLGKRSFSLKVAKKVFSVGNKNSNLDYSNSSRTEKKQNFVLGLSTFERLNKNAWKILGLRKTTAEILWWYVLSRVWNKVLKIKFPGKSNSVAVFLYTYALRTVLGSYPGLVFG